ncbi:PAS domain S-box protein (macronuclear) [Tetrahymena thermophila SB210]|uniref:PAS domain S-box protein n=1 Tax=Tetrahymena thermophila (strain SB210) TaxID=312017 RepID=I7M1P8_TETTS|nr:PAS domain S-box protein [Tetrahymena thermophila SB210]EAR97310.2 PAS domain S-box protein [Tetrahymena thermophila SB210]|eukprot:XP_001017555.2 PAS domain S-box protein [Tetrahymena thermophila SB210]
MNYFIKIKSKIKAYYEENIFSVINQYARPVLLGKTLLFIRFVFHIQLMFSQEVMNELDKKDINLNQTGRYSILYDVSYSKSLMYIGIIITGLALIALMSDFIFCQYKQSESYPNVFRIYLGFFCSIFNYALYIPLFYFSVDQVHQSNLVGLYLIFATLLIGIFISIHDLDYSIISYDSLANRESTKISLFSIVVESCACIALRQIDNPKLMLLFSILLSTLKVLTSISISGYENRNIRYFNQILSIYHFIISLFVYISLLQNSYFPITLVAVIIIPISIKITNLIDNYQHNLYNFTLEKQQIIAHPTNLDFYLRVMMKVIKLEYKDYIDNKQSIVLEYITSDHCTFCEDSPDCFCNTEPQDIRQFQDMTLEKQLRQKFMNRYVRQMYYKCIYEEIIKNKTITNHIVFSYLNFLIEMSQSKVLCFSEIIKLKKLMSLSQREIALFNYIFQKAINKFKQIDISCTLINKKKQNQKDVWKYFEDQKLNEEDIQQSRASFDEKISVTNFIVGINFDELVNQAEEQYYTTIQEKQSLLLLLFQDHIDLHELKIKAQNLMRLRESLFHQLLVLNEINQNSQKLQFYFENFINNLGFGQKKKQIFKKKKQFQNENLKIDFNIFNKDTCVVFITLVNEIGAIKKVQNKFENIFGYSSSKSIKKNINIIIPKYIQKVHDKVLSNYLKNPENVQINNFKLQIAQNEGGWAVPISLKFRPDYINLEDCGLTAFIQKIQNEYSYILLSCGNFKIQCLSQILYSKIFGKLFSQGDVYNIYLNRVIPILNYFETHQFKQADIDFVNEAVQTIAFLPKPEIIQKGFKSFNLSQKLDIADLQSYVQSLTVEYFDLYTVKLCFYNNNFQKIQYDIVELHTFKKMTSYQAQKEGLLNFKNQLQTLLNIEYDLQNDFEIIDQFIELQNLYLQQSSSEQISLFEEEGSSYEKQEKQAQLHQFNDQQIQFGIQDLSQPLFSQREHIQKELFTSEEDHAKQETSHLIGGTQLLLAKKEELLKDSDHKNCNETTNICDQHLMENFGSFSNINNNNNNIYGPLSPLSSHALFTSMLTPHNSQSEHKLFSQKQIEDKAQILKVNVKNSNSSTQIMLSDQHISSGSNTNITTQQQQKNTQKSQLKHQIHVANILKEFYDIKQKETLQVKSLLKKRITNNSFSSKIKEQLQFQLSADDKSSHQIKEEDEEEMEIARSEQDQKSLQLNQKSIFSQCENINHVDFSLCQLLKERIKQVRYQLEQQNLFKATKINSKLVTDLPNSINSQLRLSALIQGKEPIVNDSNGVTSSHQITTNSRKKQISFEKLHSSNQMERTRTKKDTTISKSQLSHKQVLKADDLTSEELSDSVAKEKEIQRDVEQQRSRILAASSINTSQSQNQEQKKSIYRMVNSDKKNYSLFVLVMFGFVALSSFSALILLQQLQNSSQYNQAIVDFKYLPWPMSIRYFYSKVFADEVVKEMYDSNFFQTFKAQPTYYKNILDRQSDGVQQYKNLLLDFMDTKNVGQNYFTNATDTLMPIYISYDPITLPQKYLNITSQKFKVQFPVLYFMQFMIHQLYRMTINEGGFYCQILQLDNFSTFNTYVTQIQTLISQSVVDITNSIRDEALIIMIVVIVVTCVLGFTTLPIYYHIQIKNEELLKLFSTISNQSLNSMLQPIQISLSSHKAQTKIKYFQLPIYKKRRAISSCSEIQKINKRYIVYIILGIVFMVVQPVASFIYINNFYNEAKVLITLIQNFYTTKAFCTSLSAISNSNLVIKSQTYQIYNSIYYVGRVQSLINQTSTYLTSFQQAIQQSQASIRFENDQYNNFFYPFITENVCDIIEKYPQHVKSQNKFDLQKCKTIKSGILNKGLQLSLKNLFETYAFLGPIYKINNTQQFIDSFYSWENSNNLVELDEFFEMITSSIEILKDFLMDRVNNFVDQMKYVLNYLLIYQLIMMIIIFYLGFVEFYKQVKNEMIQTKRMLSILSIETILDNPYILSYLNKFES